MSSIWQHYCSECVTSRDKMAAPIFDVFAGAETGFLKGVTFGKKSYANLNCLENADRKQEIVAMCWSGNKQNIFFATRNGMVKSYNTKINAFKNCFQITEGNGPVKGIVENQGTLVTCVESGDATIWKRGKEIWHFKVGPNIHRMRNNPQRHSVVATGGRDNDLAIWDLNSPQNPLFKARNVSHDFLNLRVPIWITDMRFLDSSNTVITCTGHHHIRLYDPRAQRKPVLTTEFDEYPITSMDLTHDQRVLVGNSHGRMALFDLRNMAQVGRGGMVHCYRGYFAGSIRCVQCHPTLDLVATCGLDRFLRIHDVNSRVMLHKVYLKSRLNCLLVNPDWDPLKEVAHVENVAAVESAPAKEPDDVWDKMEAAVEKEPTKKRRRKITAVGNINFERTQPIMRQ